MDKFLKEIKSLIIIIGIVFIFRSTVLNWYVIPSVSLLPTLKVGDHVVINKLSYGIMLPFMETRLLSWAQPQRGDIVVFKAPESENGLTLIKRVVGMPGDTVTFTNGVLTINGILAKEEAVSVDNPLDDAGIAENKNDYYVFQESGMSHFPHYAMRKSFGSMTEAEAQTWIVPPHKLLLIGDNRDNSKDGRFWGFMDEKNMYGRAFLISYSTYNSANSWIPKFRNNRWFKEIKN